MSSPNNLLDSTAWGLCCQTPIIGSRSALPMFPSPCPSLEKFLWAPIVPGTYVSELYDVLHLERREGCPFLPFRNSKQVTENTTECENRYFTSVYIISDRRLLSVTEDEPCRSRVRTTSECAARLVGAVWIRARVCARLKKPPPETVDGRELSTAAWRCAALPLERNSRFVRA